MTTDMPTVPDALRDLIDRPLLVMLGTTLPNNTPQVTPVWFYEEGGYFYFNTAVGRLKDKAIRANPYVSLLVMDPDNGFRYLQVRGPVVEFLEGEAGRAGINRLAGRYTGNPIYSFGPPEELRVHYKVKPEHILAFG